MTRFPHVAVPVAELLPQMGHPETGVPLQTIAERLQEGEKAGESPLWKRNDFW